MHCVQQTRPVCRMFAGRLHPSTSATAWHCANRTASPSTQLSTATMQAPGASSSQKVPQLLALSANHVTISTMLVEFAHKPQLVISHFPTGTESRPPAVLDKFYSHNIGHQKREEKSCFCKHKISFDADGEDASDKRCHNSTCTSCTVTMTKTM